MESALNLKMFVVILKSRVAFTNLNKFKAETYYKLLTFSFFKLINLFIFDCIGSFVAVRGFL